MTTIYYKPVIMRSYPVIKNFSFVIKSSIISHGHQKQIAKYKCGLSQKNTEETCRVVNSSFQGHSVLGEKERQGG